MLQVKRFHLLKQIIKEHANRLNTGFACSLHINIPENRNYSARMIGFEFGIQEFFPGNRKLVQISYFFNFS